MRCLQVRGHLEEQLNNQTTVELPIGDERKTNETACDAAYGLPPNRMCTGDKLNCANPRTAKTTVVLLEHGFYDDQIASKVLLIPHTGLLYAFQSMHHCIYLIFSLTSHFWCAFHNCAFELIRRMWDFVYIYLMQNWPTVMWWSNPLTHIKSESFHFSNLQEICTNYSPPVGVVASWVKYVCRLKKRWHRFPVNVSCWLNVIESSCSDQKPTTGN